MQPSSQQSASTPQSTLQQSLQQSLTYTNNPMGSTEIQTIIDTNKVNDLRFFLRKRHQLNTLNMYMMYLFHFFQSVGIVASSVGTSTNTINYVWIGIALNTVASLFQIYEKLNTTQLDILLENIKRIQGGTYIDENAWVPPLQPSTTPSPV